MEEFKGTTEEWELSKNSNQGIRINAGQDNPITMTTICSLSGSSSSQEVRSNAQLISAAPELLEALQFMYGLGDMPTSEGEISKAYQMAAKAINKALGNE